jgi:hypothetical protein
MLQYRRRNSNTPLQTRTTTPVHILLTYCNWSYHRDSHIGIDTLISMLTQFQEEYVRFYLRMINETPRGLIYSFMTQEHLNPNVLEGIYQVLESRGFDLRDFREL